MVVGSVKSSNGKIDLVVCPAGCVNGWTINSKFQKQDGRCELCRGLGVIAVRACRCGRPILPTKEGQIEKGVWCCGRKACAEAMKPKVVKGEDLELDMRTGARLPFLEMYGAD